MSSGPSTGSTTMIDPVGIVGSIDPESTISGCHPSRTRTSRTAARIAMRTAVTPVASQPTTRRTTGRRRLVPCSAVVVIGSVRHLLQPDLDGADGDCLPHADLGILRDGHAQFDQGQQPVIGRGQRAFDGQPVHGEDLIDRKSTRLNSSHVAISYAVFCLKKKKNLLSQLS